MIFEGACEGNIENIVEDYFDLNRDYEKIKEKLSKIDDNLKQSTEYGKGIPRIKGIIERISKMYGKKIEYKGREYYTFPEICELKKASVEDLRALGLGFRDKRVYDTTEMFIDKKITLEELENEQNIEILRDKLMKLPGVRTEKLQIV